MTEVIRTTKNKSYKYIRSFARKKTRLSEQAFTVEGVKSVSDAVRAEMDIRLVAMSETYYKSGGADGFSQYRHIVVQDELFFGLCDTDTPQGVIAVIGMDRGRFEYRDGGLYVYCDRISDPGNLGTIIRTADAAGLDGVLISPGCADRYSPKTVRASMGSFFHIPMRGDVDARELSELQESGAKLYAGALTDDSIPYTDADMTGTTVIIVGNEANGVSDEILAMSKHIIIPIYGRAESLNAGVAAAVMMYEAARQRGTKNG